MAISGTVTVTITSGGSPLGVVFDASGLTSDQCDTDHTFDQCRFEWTFGDPGSGTWSVGAFQGQSRNTHEGPIGAHVYEPALDSGTTVYTPTLTVYEPNGSGGRLEGVTVTVPTISVTDENTHWSGSTWCFSDDADFTGAPSGATEVTQTSLNTIRSNYMTTSGRRFLFKRGATFTGEMSGIVGPDICIGAFGSGNKPVLDGNAGTTGIIDPAQGASQLQDFRVKDVRLTNCTQSAVMLDGMVSGHADFTMLRVDCDNCESMCQAQDGNFGGDSGAYLDGLIIQECDTSNNDMWSTGYIGADHFAMLGCVSNETDEPSGGEHNIRVHHARYFLMAHNAFDLSHQHVIIKMHARDESTTFKTSFGQIYKNRFDCDGGTVAPNVLDWPVNLTAEGASTNSIGGTPSAGYQEHLEDIIVEKNFWDVTSPRSNFQALRLEGVRMCARNNVILHSSAVTSESGQIQIIEYGGTDDGAVLNRTPDDCSVINNTLFSPRTSGTARICNVGAGVGVENTNPPTGTMVRGNLVYVPNGTADTLTDNAAVNETTTSANVATSVAGTADLSTDPPTQESHFVRTGDNADGASDNRLFSDISGNWRRTGTPDAGASETTDDGSPGVAGFKKLFLYA